MDVSTSVTGNELTNYVSPSRLKLWLKCPLAYRLRYVDGIETPTTPNLFLGQIVHRALEFYYGYRRRYVTLYPEIVSDHIQQIWAVACLEASITFNSGEEEAQLKSQAVNLVETYLAQVRTDEGAPLAVEERLRAPLIDPANGDDLGIALVGVLDLVLEDSDGPVIVDFKTAARSSDKLDIIHELQLTCYSYLFRRVTGRTEAGLEIRSLIKTKTPKIQTHRYEPRSELHFTRLFSVIRAYLDAVDTKQFYIRPGLECTFCDYQGTHCLAC